MIATLLASTLFAAAAAVAEEQDSAARTETQTASKAVELNQDRARLAHNAAVEDAVEAVLEANRLRLDIRLLSRTSGQMADSR